MKKLINKTAIVTGGAQGFGRAIAEKLAEEGAFVNIFDKGCCAETLKLIKDAGNNAAAHKVNIADSSEVESAVKKIIEATGVDILINNAGVVSAHENLLSVTDDIWDREIAVNLSGTFYCCRAVLDHMIEKKSGKIVNISSIAGATGRNQTSPAYSAAKAGVYGLTMSIAKSVAKHGVNVNAIAPGMIWTDMLSVYPKEATDKGFSEIPFARAGRPEDVANAVLFLVSDESGFITGARMHLNGGAWMG